MINASVIYMISIGFYMWEQRNSVQHSDDNVQLRERHRTVDEGIHSQFDMGPDDLPPEIQPISREEGGWHSN